MAEDFPFFDDTEFSRPHRIACPYRMLSNIGCVLDAGHEGPHQSDFNWQLWAHSPIVDAEGQCLRCHRPEGDGIHKGYALRRVR